MECKLKRMPIPDGCVHGVVTDHTVSEVSHPHGLRGILFHDLQTGGAMRVAFLELSPQPENERSDSWPGSRVGHSSSEI